MAALVLSLLYHPPSTRLPIMPIKDEDTQYRWQVDELTRSMPDCIDTADDAHLWLQGFLNRWVRLVFARIFLY